MGHVLEHVENPKEILQKAKTWLKSGGRIFCAVPNSHSLHRQAAVLMGLLENEKAQSQADILHGHRRCYDLDELCAEFERAGLKIIKSGGYWLKALSHAQIESTWSDEMIAAFMILGESYPNIAGDIFVVAEK